MDSLATYDLLSILRGEVRVMQRAEALMEIIHERGKRGLPLERLYRHLFNPELYLRAYGKIYRNDGSMTPGSNEETVDGMSLKKIQAIIDALRYERYRWAPVRRVYIVRREALCCIPNIVGRNLEGGFWA
jgi:hypothetical protein